jgi:hypothetical protein
LPGSSSSDTFGHRNNGRGAALDKFSFFFAFYGLILGLAVAELLGGFAGMVRARALKKLDPQIALLALLTFVIICATWIDAWATERSVTVDFAGLWAPILIGTSYYLAAAVIFPRGAESYDGLAAYYEERKSFIILMLIVAELLVSVTYRHRYADFLAHRPMILWLWQVPYKVAILASYAWIWRARSCRSNIAALVVCLLLFTIPYWQYAIIPDLISRHYGY